MSTYRTPEQRAQRKKAQDAWNARNPDYHKQYYANNKEHIKQKSSENFKKRKARSPWRELWRHARTRAAQYSFEFNLTHEYLESIWPDACPVLGIPLYPNTGGKAHDNSPSLDRIDSSKGYVIGNVAIISYRANVIKNSGSADEHRLIAEWMDKTTACNTLPEPETSTSSGCVVSNDQS